MSKVESSSTMKPINIEQGNDQITTREAKGKAPLLAMPPPGIYYYDEEARGGGSKSGGGYTKGLAVFDFVLRICALTSALAAAIAMGTTEQTLPFFTQFFQFQASYDDLPAFQFFVIAMAIATGYFVLSIPFSIVCIIRPQAVAPRLLLIIFDTVTVAFTTAAASSAAAIVYLAHEGNSSANWLAICDQFDDFCQRVSGAVVASFISITLLIFIVIVSTIALRKQ